ncbi:hypothetical protein CH063_05125 [Colletotrichum higginsianum]|uniref:Uncharacterized protein n=1 Tax=Colletotrichum higginsianum (strain IMI 349063) TaxID=759273 RepID=H1UXV7_COLHI|nr:hypothetical protein CH063_05125 [Colletotrichum higginsianum]
MKTTSLFHVSAAVAREFFIFDTGLKGSLEASIIAYNHKNATTMLPTRPPMRPASRKATGRSSDEQEIPDQYGVCFVTTVNAAGSRTVGPGMPANTCFSEAHSVVVAFTAGLD